MNQTSVKADMPQVFFEFRKYGDIMRVSAIDEATGSEAVVQGPSKAARADLQQLALNKLKYLMKKEAEGSSKQKTD